MKVAISTTDAPRIDGAEIAVLKGKWRSDVVEAMTAKCRHTLVSLGADAPREHTVPGSLELPSAAQYLIENSRSPLDAVICFSVIVKGDTLHFELISHEVMRGLGRVSFATRTPIITEVLAVFDLSDAIERTQDDEYNKGLEAAVTAAEIIAWRRAVVLDGDEPRST
jgi:6,7-dimethyl-8-ribityllumazine synthase